MRKQKTKRNLIGLSWLKVMGSTLFAPTRKRNALTQKKQEGRKMTTKP